ncbi:hypothetical protein N7605_18145 [Pantoea ananatis]|uniref:hypothetical protein n=1 Tax=Pantoea ananas TaxID=553 RepID=UPI00287D07CC|nr:hypothetical protein [Pantoea ananatis]MDS7721725.1 hypothetical protein [Pantoea ananatis]
MQALTGERLRGSYEFHWQLKKQIIATLPVRSEGRKAVTAADGSYIRRTGIAWREDWHCLPPLPAGGRGAAKEQSEAMSFIADAQKASD